MDAINGLRSEQEHPKSSRFRMLIEFSVSNFRSFRERQTFSMVAESRLRRGKENLITPDTDEKLPKLLKIAAIYGPNASGKSSFLKAFDVISSVARREPSVSGRLPVFPFRFDRDLLSQPSRFELNFIADRCRFQFDLAATEDRIVEERLTAYPKGKEVVLYDRQYSERGEVYSFSEKLEGGRDLHETWRKLTGPATLFISQAVANSSEDLKQLRPAHRWLTNGCFVVEGDMPRMSLSSRRLAKDHKLVNDRISTFLRELDVPIKEMKFETIAPIDTDSVATEKAVQAVNKYRLDKNTKTTLVHSSALGDANFDYSEESDGTRALIGFWLPWSLMTEGAELSPFRVCAVDELDSSLHPQIVARLIDMHQKSEAAGQLIFTTHDTHLMDTKLLRRDQIWLTERDANGATQLRSLHDFVGRESEDVEKRYYEGRYRSLPILRNS